MHLLLDCVNLLSTTGKLYLMACSDAKRSNSGNSYFVQISWNTLGDSSIRLSFGNFWKPIWPHDVFGRCRFPNLFRNGYHLLALFITSPPLDPPIFIIYERVLKLSTWKWNDLSDLSDLRLIIFKPKPFWRHLIVLLFWSLETQLVCHCDFPGC